MLSLSDVADKHRVTLDTDEEKTFRINITPSGGLALCSSNLHTNDTNARQKNAHARENHDRLSRSSIDPREPTYFFAVFAARPCETRSWGLGFVTLETDETDNVLMHLLNVVETLNQHNQVNFSWVSSYEKLISCIFYN